MTLSTAVFEGQPAIWHCWCAPVPFFVGFAGFLIVFYLSGTDLLSSKPGDTFTLSRLFALLHFGRIRVAMQFFVNTLRTLLQYTAKFLPLICRCHYTYPGIFKCKCCLKCLKLSHTLSYLCFNMSGQVYLNPRLPSRQYCYYFVNVVTLYLLGTTV